MKCLEKSSFLPPPSQSIWQTEAERLSLHQARNSHGLKKMAEKLQKCIIANRREYQLLTKEKSKTSRLLFCSFTSTWEQFFRLPKTTLLQLAGKSNKASLQPAQNPKSWEWKRDVGQYEPAQDLLITSTSDWWQCKQLRVSPQSRVCFSSIGKGVSWNIREFARWTQFPLQSF